MAGNWSYAPQYVCRLYQGGGRVWDLTSLQSAQLLQVTGAGVSECTVVLGDPQHHIKRMVQPHAMDVLEIWIANRWGEGGLCGRWYLDEPHRAFDPQQGDAVTLVGTGAVKLFEQTRQTPADVAGLALAYAQNITGSAVLTYAAKACRYPHGMLRIHPQADAGSGYQSIGGQVFTNPDQQPWSAVVSAFQANSGLEWFFDEGGYCYWRPVGFLDPWFGTSTRDRPRPTTIQPRRIDDEDIIQADFAESDKGIVTRIEVRYYGTGFTTQAAARWQAPAAMESHLGVRSLVVPAQWITNPDHAQYLAQVVGTQMSAGLAIATLTIPADPLITIGSLVDVPALGIDGTTRYYVSSITYMLQWGDAWNMVLGLSYGRGPQGRFPYAGSVSYPVLTDKQWAQVPAGGANPGVSVLPLALAPDNTAWDTAPHPLVAQRTLSADQAATDLYNPGAVIQVYSAPRSHGASVGPGSTGDYTVVAPLSGQASGTIALKDTSAGGAQGSVGTGYVTIIDAGQSVQNDPTAGSLPDVTVQGTGSATTGTGFAASASGTQPPSRGLATGTLAMKALALAYSVADPPGVSHYRYAAAGPSYWDCSGLVYWAYQQCGFNWGGIYHNSGLEYNYLLAHGARAITVDQAVPGDLLFIGPGVHVGFCYKAGGVVSGQTYGANNDDPRNPSYGLRVSDINGYHGDDGSPFNLALDMSEVTPNS